MLTRRSKPTQEQIREFWGWVFGKDGVEFAQSLNNRLCVYKRTNWLEAEEAYNIEFLGYDIINLKTLFEYAVPKAMEMGDVGFLKWDGQRKENRYTIFNQNKRFTDTDDPALAIFWALWEVKENE